MQGEKDPAEGSALGQAAKERQEKLEALRLEREESGERNAIEGCIGVCKRRYGLDVVMMRLKHTSEVDIYATILTRNLFKRVRVLFWLIWRRVQQAYTSSLTDRKVLPGCLCA